MKFLSIIAVCTLPVLVACQDSPTRKDIIEVDGADQEMKAAMQAARDSFPEFWRQVSEDYKRIIPVLTGSMVKAYFTDPDDPDGGEHMWVADVDYDGEVISGTLMSRPGNLKSVSSGDKVSFKLDRLSDWLIVNDGVATGAYTVQLLRSRMKPEERKDHDAHYPFQFPELGAAEKGR